MGQPMRVNPPLDTGTVLANIRCEIGLPMVAHKVLELMHSSQADAQALAAIIAQDQALSLRVLKLANSPFYGFSRKISTIQDAVVILGDKALRNMVLILAMKGMHNHFGSVEQMLWEESMAYAMAARFLARQVPGQHPEEAFMAGLMSNVGEVVANNDNPSLYRTAFEQDRQCRPGGQLSSGALPYSFTTLGAAILDSWNFSNLLVASLFYAECSDLEGREEQHIYQMCAIVFLARQLCHSLGLGGYSGSEAPVFGGYAVNALGLSSQDLGALRQEFSQFYSSNAPSLLSPD